MGCDYSTGELSLELISKHEVHPQAGCTQPDLLTFTYRRPGHRGGVKLQSVSDSEEGRTHWAVAVSKPVETWKVVGDGLVSSVVIKDVSPLPQSLSKSAEEPIRSDSSRIALFSTVKWDHPIGQRGHSDPRGPRWPGTALGRVRGSAAKFKAMVSCQSGRWISVYQPPGMWSTHFLTREIERDYRQNIRCSKNY